MSWREEVSSLQKALQHVEDAADEVESQEARIALLARADEIREQIRYTGPYIPDSPGFSRPGWMDDESYAEFRMTPEYAAEVSYVPDEPFELDDYWQE